MHICVCGQQNRKRKMRHTPYIQSLRPNSFFAHMSLSHPKSLEAEESVVWYDLIRSVKQWASYSCLCSKSFSLL